MTSEEEQDLVEHGLEILFEMDESEEKTLDVEIENVLDVWRISSNFIEGEEVKIAIFDTGKEEPGVKVKDTSDVNVFIKQVGIEDTTSKEFIEWQKNKIKSSTPYTDAMERKVSYLSPQGHTCKMIRATENTVTLLIYDNPNDPHEWTTTIDNFCKNYKAIS